MSKINDILKKAIAEGWGYSSEGDNAEYSHDDFIVDDKKVEHFLKDELTAEERAFVEGLQ